MIVRLISPLQFELIKEIAPRSHPPSSDVLDIKLLKHTKVYIKNGKMKNTLREIILDINTIEPKDITELLQNIAEESQECAEKRLRIAFR